MKTFHTALFMFGIIVSVSLTIANAAEPATKSSGLTDSDKKLLDKILKQFLFDPVGSQYVQVKTTCRTAWGSDGQIARYGWLKSEKPGYPARVFFTDGWSISAPESDRIEKIDFLDLCRKHFIEAEKPLTEEQKVDSAMKRMGMISTGYFGESNLARAAWLHLLGQPELASKSLQIARKEAEEYRGSYSQDDESQVKESADDRLVRYLREDLAWEAFAGMVHAYLVRADQDAFDHAERLMRLYPDIVKRQYKQAEVVLAELKRRKEKGTYGKTPPDGFPEGFAAWGQKKKVEWLINSLEEVDVRQFGQPGGVPLGMDRRVEALIEIGDPAVPLDRYD